MLWPFEIGFLPAVYECINKFPSEYTAAAGKAATVLINVELSIQAHSVPLILHDKQKPKTCNPSRQSIQWIFNPNQFNLRPVEEETCLKIVG